MTIYNLNKFTIDVHNNVITIPAQEVDVDLLLKYGYVDLLHENYPLVILRLVGLVGIEHISSEPLSPYEVITIDVCDEYDPYFVYQRIEHEQR